jgi:uncharacterized membrane protein
MRVATLKAHRVDLAAVAVGLLLAATTFLRFTVYADRPLWLDEVWTGMIVTRPSLAEFVRQCSLDANAPLYSVLAAPWAMITGISDRALRSLPAVMGSLAPLIALTPSDQTVNRPTRLTWCGLLACWVPGLWFSQEARPYTLALALAVANACAFASLIERPSHRSAWAWTAVSCLLILSHYFGAVLVGIQGVAYLVIHELRAVRTWPASLAFLPALAALSVQAPGLIGFSAPQHSWIPYGSVQATLGDLAFILDPVLLIATSAWFIGIILIGRLYTGVSDEPKNAEHRGPWLTAACSAVAVIATIGLSFVRPMVIPRYFLEFVPGLFLGLSLAAADFSRRLPFGSAPLVAIFAAAATYWAATLTPGGNTFSWERASEALAASHPKHLVFMWDTPLGGEPTSLEGVGGFFFARAGSPVTVEPAIDTTGEDPNLLLLKLAGSDPQTVIIWIYDLHVRNTNALKHPPRIEQIDPRWECKNFGVQSLAVIGCSRR